jgi:hypothetical protein
MLTASVEMKFIAPDYTTPVVQMFAAHSRTRSSSI